MTVHALEAARRLAPRFAARAAEHDRDGSFPVEDFRDLREAGLFGLMVPRALGGQGATFAEYAAVATELARGNGATALVFNMHASVTGALGAVTEELAEALGVPTEALAARDRLLTAAAQGSWYAVAMSERGAGARLSQLSTVYESTDEGWHLKGSKTFCSGAGHADGYLVAARSAADQSVVSQFLVPAGPAGLTVEPTWDALGMRATSSHDLHLDVAVPTDRLLGGVEGLALVVAQLMPHWLVASYAAVYVGWPGRRSTRRPSTSTPATWPVCRRCGPGSVGRTRRRRRPSWWWPRRPVGWTRRRATRRPTVGCGGPSCSPAPRQRRWPRPCWRRPAPRRPGAAIHWSGSTGTPAVAHCTRPPRMSAPTGLASPHWAATRTATGRLRVGEPVGFDGSAGTAGGGGRGHGSGEDSV
ncbi:hypothetical protein GCM10027614_53380 [Micromonospora vulcania]